MKHKRQSPITQVFHFFIYYKIFELIISLTILAITYKFFPRPFQFLYGIIQQYINQ